MTRIITNLLAAAALIAPIASTGAQSTDQAITVTGSQQRVIGRSYMTGAPIHEYSVSITISTGDLNLRDTADWQRLEDRVQQAALHGCTWLETRYALDTDRDCSRVAARKGMAEARRIAASSTRVASLSFGIGTASARSS